MPPKSNNLRFSLLSFFVVGILLLEADCKPSKVQVQFVNGTAVVKSGTESRPSAAEGDLMDVFETKEGYMDVTTLSLGVQRSLEMKNSAGSAASLPTCSRSALCWKALFNMTGSCLEQRTSS